MTTPDTNEPETFEHMLTTFGIMVVDAEGKDDENDRRQEAFDYANDWLATERQRWETAARKALPVKYDIDPKEYKSTNPYTLDKVSRQLGYNTAIDDVIAALTTVAETVQSDTEGKQ